MTQVPIGPREAATRGALVQRLRRALIGAAVVAGVVLSGTLGVFAGRTFLSPEDDGTSVRSSPSVITAVRDLSRIEGAEYHIERVITLTEKQSRLFGLIEAEDALILVASGDVVAGVDLSSLPEDAIVVEPDGKAVSIVLPRSTIFSARLDSERTYVYRRDTDLLANRKETLEARARQEAEKTLMAAAQEGGIIRRADDSVRRTIESLVRSLGYSNVRVSFK